MRYHEAYLPAERHHFDVSGVTTPPFGTTAPGTW